MVSSVSTRLVGMQFAAGAHLALVGMFAAASKAGVAEIEVKIERQPENPHDPCALRVLLPVEVRCVPLGPFGKDIVTTAERSIHIGYVERNAANYITRKSDGAPLRCSVTGVRVAVGHESNPGIDLRVCWDPVSRVGRGAAGGALSAAPGKVVERVGAA